MSLSLLTKSVLFSLLAMALPWQPLHAGGCGPGGVGVLCSQGSDPFGRAFSGNPMGVPIPVVPMPGFGGSSLPGLDVALLSLMVSALQPLPSDVLEMARSLLRLPPGTDFTQIGAGPALVIAGDPKKSEEALPEFQDERHAFMESGVVVAKHFQKNKLNTQTYFTSFEWGYENAFKDPLEYVKKLNALLSVVETYPGFFQKLALVSHASITKDKGVYVEPIIGQRGITLTGEQIRTGKIFFYGCGAQKEGLNIGQMQRLAEEHAATGDYFRALSNRGGNWNDKIYGMLGMQAPRNRTQMKFTPDEDLQRWSFFERNLFWFRR